MHHQLNYSRRLTSYLIRDRGPPAAPDSFAGNNPGGNCKHTNDYVHSSSSSNCHHARPPNWPMRKCALHFLNIISSLYLILSLQAHTPFSFHTNLHGHLAPMISTVSLLNELLPMPMIQRCHVLCFTILYLSTTEFPIRFSFFLNKHLNCL